MKTLLVSSLLISTAFVISSCKKSNPVGPSEGQQIWPLKTGNTWVYHLVAYDSTGVAVGSTSVSYSVTSDTVADGRTWYHLSNSGSAYYTNKSDGLWLLLASSSSSVQQLFYKYPSAAGDSWSYGSVHISVQSADTSITVPEGTHGCVAYRWSGDPKFGRVDYLCPGLGWVATDYFAIDATGHVYKNETLRLTSVRLN